MFYDETWDPEEFLSYIADETRKNVLWLRKDARELNEIFHNRRIVDVVFTDPPYKGKDESVQYFEVCTLYVSILSLDQEWAKRYGTNDWWQKEVIENDRQGKTFETYIDALAECLSSVNRIVKESGIWIVTYHSPSPEVWDSIRHVFRRIGLNIPPYQEIQSHAVRRGQTMYTERYGTIGKDAYIVLSRDREGIAPSKRITDKEFMALAFKALRKELQEKDGIVTWDAFGKVVGEILMRYGAPVERSSDIREIFDKYTIELAPGYRIFDRDAMGDELWNEVYHNIPIETLLLKCLTLYGESKQRIPREEIIYRLLPKLNGRVKTELLQEIISKIFVYDPVNNSYVFQPRQKTLDRELTTRPSRKLVLPKTPEEIIEELRRTASYYGHQVIKTYKLTDISVRIPQSNRVAHVFIRDEARVRRASAWTDQEKRQSTIVFLYYGLSPERLKNLQKLLSPATLIAVPYPKWAEIVKAFRDPDPEKYLEEYEVR